MEDIGIRALNVVTLINLLAKTYTSLFKGGVPFVEFPTVMLWGAPGVGKSQGVRQIADRIYKNTGKEVRITDVRLLLFNPVDLRGIPTSNAEKTEAVWLRPQIFKMDPSENIVNILFLDEITSASTSVQAAAYQITLDRTIGEHRLPENCIVIAAGNRVTDRSVSYNMPRALANRLCHFEIREDASSWHDWAIRNGIHPYVVGFIEYSSTSLNRANGMELAFPTPRSWEMVSNILNSVSEDMRAVFPMVAGCIGDTSASQLQSWTELYKGLPNVEEIFEEGKGTLPKERELQIALKSKMVQYARLHPKKTLIDNSVEYSCKMPWTFRGKLMRDYYRIPEVREILEDNDVFKTAVRDGLTC